VAPEEIERTKRRWLRCAEEGSALIQCSAGEGREMGAFQDGGCKKGSGSGEATGVVGSAGGAERGGVVPVDGEGGEAVRREDREMCGGRRRDAVRGEDVSAERIRLHTISLPLHSRHNGVNSTQLMRRRLSRKQPQHGY
jgi:hypothetical protein